jgi:hypothetical protein
MRITLIILLFFFSGFSSYAQEKKITQRNSFANDTLSVKGTAKRGVLGKGLKSSIGDYLIISENSDTTYVDTTLNIKKEYKYNYLRKDNFNLIQFANVGQTYNTLSFDNSSNKILPLFAARARHFNYMETEDIHYYSVPTPLTELFYKTAFQQGQILDAFFTVNTSKQFNFSIAYKGMRSLGNYQNALASSGNFRFTSNYVSENKRYMARGHIVLQNLFNQENGGLSDEGVISFKDGDEQFSDRSVFDPNFDNAENTLKGKRFLLDHGYAIIKQKDSMSSTNLSLDHSISFEDKFYQFNQEAADPEFFGDSFTATINDKVTLEHFYTSLGLSLKNKTIGDISFQVNYNAINYGYNSLVVLDNRTITNRVKTDFLGFQGSYKKKLGAFYFNGSLGANLSDAIKGNFADGNLSYQLSDEALVQGSLNINSRRPNFNHLLFQSDYTNYNWDNQNTFENVNTQQVAFHLFSEKYLNASVDVTNIDNFTYFSAQSSETNFKTIKPQQYNEAIQYVRVKLQKEFRYGKFALDNTIMYQKVSNGDNVLNVPSVITRNTLYFTDDIFDKALKFQAGVIFNYFTAYNGDGYDPLLAEFYTQNETAIGGFPRLDFFINAKVRQTRIFIKAEHFNSSFTGLDYFSAPNHPYRDFAIRFGVVWNFFL